MIESIVTLRYYRTQHIDLVCEPGNRLWDEKFVMPHVARHRDITIVVDMSQQIAPTSDQHFDSVTWVDGRIYRPWTAATDDAIVAMGVVEYAKQKAGSHNCVDYWDQYTWLCVSANTRNLVYKWQGGRMVVEYVKPRSLQDSGMKLREAAFFHLHSWKKSFTWQIQPDGYYGAAIRFTSNDGDGDTGTGGTLAVWGEKHRPW